MTSLDDFSIFNFTAEGSTRPVYYKGKGPAVVIMHELPGLIPQCVELARRIEKEGFTVFLPLLFGEPNQPCSIPKILAAASQICISNEFYAFAKHKSSPITNWLRALCRKAKEDCNNQGVGLIGMCLTGGFVLSLMADDSVLAPVASQPSLPLPITPAHRAALGVSPQELAQAKARNAQGIPLIALRFSEDKSCPRERFKTLRKEFGEGIEIIEIDSSKDNPNHISQNAHAVFTVHFVEQPDHPTRQALDRVLTIFKERLKG